MLLIPIKTDRPRIRPAYLTIALIVLMTLVQVLSRVMGTVDAPVRIGGETIVIAQERLVRDYGLWGSHPDFVTFFTHMFIHGDELHLAGNMLFLWIFGSLIEDTLRPWGLAALYLLGGILAAIAHLGMTLFLGQDMDVPMVGASGAVAAVMGLFVLRFYRTRIEIFYWFFIRGTFWVASVWALAFWIGMEFLSGLATASERGGGVAHWAHVGGFLAGAAFAPFLGSVQAARNEYITNDPETNVEYVRRSEQVAAAEKALKAEPGNATLMLRLAQCYRYAGEYEHATMEYQRCVYRFAGRGQMEQAGHTFVEMMEYNDAAVLPPEILVKIAQHLETTHLSHAIGAYQHLCLRHVTRPEAEYALLRLGVIYGQTLRRPEEALRCFQEFERRYPRSPWLAQAVQLRQQLETAPPAAGRQS